MTTQIQKVDIKDAVFVLKKIIKIIEKSKKVERMNFEIRHETYEIPDEYQSTLIPSGWVNVDLNFLFCNKTKT